MSINAGRKITAMSRRIRSKSAASRRAHERDFAVRTARQQGYRSRAAIKLLEMDNRAGVFRRGDRVADLGSAPGGWSQVAVEKTGGLVAAVDLLAMRPLDGVFFVRGDFQKPQTAAALVAHLGGAVDVVLSDMSPNLSGIAAADQERAAALARAALSFAEHFLVGDGRLLVKCFDGLGFAELRQEVSECFAKVRILHPPSSRQASREVYIFAAGRRKV